MHGFRIDLADKRGLWLLNLNSSLQDECLRCLRS